MDIKVRCYAEEVLDFSIIPEEDREALASALWAEVNGELMLVSCRPISWQYDCVGRKIPALIVPPEVFHNLRVPE